MTSTRDLSTLVGLDALRRLTKSLATLDAILSPDWEFRYYSFNARWGAGEEMASMRNGEGDRWFALLTSEGAALVGLAHEADMARPGDPWPGLFDGLPERFAASVRDEPAFESLESTFCIWRERGDAAWSRGRFELPAGEDPDGSADLLVVLDGDPARYVAFAATYYERELAHADVASIYAHAPLTPALIRRLNPDVSLADLADDLAEIGYPCRPLTSRA